MDSGCPAAPPHILFEDVHMAFDDRVVHRSLRCSFERGRISVILGGSGSGKSTLLRLIGGLVRPDAGRILVGGSDVTQLSDERLFEVRSRIGMLFQHGALLDSMTVFDNLALPLRERGLGSEIDIASRVREQLASVGLDDVEALLPGQLSGGMLRRAALARAMILRPEILLCDEPFSGLDPISLRRIEALLAGINERFGTTLLVVSHHIASTFRLADQVVLLLPGRSVSGPPGELAASADREVSGFFDEGSPLEYRRGLHEAARVGP
ncbi:MAG: ATP-binding cassette domain-containing protein [Deltaproteobacteria bacterium]|nr:ATP-binding cassette domain-containing protein [Deltaproteobacteria bacterium]